MPQPIPTPNTSVVLRETVDDWVVLFNPDSGSVLGVNPVGAAVWKLLDGRRGAAEIAAAIRERFRDVPGTAGPEITAFLAQLEAGGFVGYDLRERGP